MRRKIFIKSLFVSFLIFNIQYSIFHQEAFAQSKKDLEQKKAQLHKDIEYTNKLLDETKKNKTVSLNHLVTLNKKISIRVELIQTINNEIQLLQKQIDEASSVITALENDIKKLKEEYAKMIYFAYKNQGAYNRLMFIFAAKDFNQAYKRLTYLQQYSEYRKTQKELIEKTQEMLKSKKSDLENKKLAKTELLTNEEKEKLSLNKEKVEQVDLVNSLQQKEKDLKAQLKKKQKDEEKLNKAIEDIIRREIEEARKKAEKTGKKNVTGFALTPEAQKLSDDFASNKGKLPWPVEQGVITETFGEHSHPVLKGIVTKNNGIDINSHKGAVARAVFDGEVSGVIVIPGAYKAVLVRHGEYLSVYSNLEEVYVKMGQKVTTKQSIGLIHTNDDDAKTEVHLEIWKSTTKMDPENWLYMKR